MNAPLKTPHRRYNPLLDEWVLCSPHRLQRPWQGQVEDEATENRPGYDPSCYLCPGNLRANGERNPAYTATFAFDNDFAALLPDSAIAPVDEDGLLVAEPATGRCRVLCFSPRHDLTLAEMDVEAIRSVVDTWAREVKTIGAEPAVRYVQVFENKGAMMGCSNPHPHGQVWATSYVPVGPARKLETQRAYFERHGRDLLGDYLRKELAAGERIVCRNDHWVALVPFWAVWPFEILLVPARRVPDLPSLREAERDGARGHPPPGERALRQPLPHVLPVLDGVPRAPHGRRGAPLVAAARRLLPPAAALGHGAQVPGRLRADRRAAARPHRRGRGLAPARAGRDPLPEGLTP